MPDDRAAPPLAPPAPLNRRLAVGRTDYILQSLDASGSVSVADMSMTLGVSRETIRRDLKALAEQGRVSLVHGGAAKRAVDEPSLATREAANAAGKAAIGAAAAQLVADGMVVLIDSGSTTLGLAAALTNHSDLTVITNSLPIGLLLCRAPGVKVIVLGGDIEPNDEAAFGIETMTALAHYRVDLVFLGVSGISPEGEFTDYSRLAAEQRHLMMNAGKAVYVLADHTKFEHGTPVRITPVPHIAGVVVDAPPPPRIARAFELQQWRVIVANGER
ncbi:DeoR/GlpR transcriptional regulator [Paraburkholderia guartelaensis]|uniref:DeoR/GlpR transcriptional regulator n=1 Tax=Paraburkholderia guartelaensis TaxID=2546446 RepID=A0A4R5LC90_9BURK|nr:DeoR/GlpR family DNA-binding transcription regulator [Paraburkholderia guartelaensis]TDG06027.1 DeoR/GlpR transcriptional regulator [Paraburkholderia guartelaensis]